MTLAPVRDPQVVEAVARRHPGLHVYVLGDLDEPYWQASSWWVDRDRPGALCGLVSGPEFELPLFYAVAHPDEVEGVAALVAEVNDQLPDEMLAMIDPIVARTIAPGLELVDPVRHEKWVLDDPRRMRIGSPGIVSLGDADHDELVALYATEADGGRSMFTRTMLATGCYLGVRRGDELVSVAGVHLFSPARRAAALGNVFTHPAHRGQGLARLVSSALCHRLGPAVDLIGLNVALHNEAARSCYASMGFTVAGTYLDGVLKRS